ncbi:Bug family tripartite tricarboxylate transporter substrate binding protein [Cellulosimicrobium arenosum]|uniref:Tripartite tricarboxylate transporter substrate binding protein n=1 Tax=Cellulosimicrobium arenosum TaxID=2708133 RepID=A0A927G8D5_9MICO|nr:tripartite tricarboxylate transporter substrate binding protein [Cellulosimicrobium arenosum]MBD8078603.1 tripartite tricarboxylate transporter substrate binding protein [Cellulosimicrobium arenosum]
MTRRTTRTFTVGAALAVSGLALAACSDSTGSGGGGDSADFPEDDVTLIVQADAGGGSDLTSRALATELEPVLGVSIVVENRPGASGSTAMQYVAGEEPDGYTIGFSPVEISMLGHEGYDVDPADYDFLGQIMLAPGVLVVPADSPYDTLEDFVEAGQDQSLSVANSGAGSIWEIAAFGLADATGAQLDPVPFDGGAPALAAAVGGQVDAAVAGAGEVSAAVDDGQVKALAVFHDEPYPDLPDVPTAADAGYEDLEFGGWGGIYAPAGLPDDVRSTLESGIEEAATSEGFEDTVTKSGNLVVYKSADEFTDFVNSEYDRFGTLLGNG